MALERGQIASGCRVEAEGGLKLKLMALVEGEGNGWGALPRPLYPPRYRR